MRRVYADSLTPEAGLVVLKNGNVLEGNVTRAGDYYIVTQGQSSELRLPAAQVEAFCGSLDEAYEFKQRHLAGRGAKPHLDLAEWCLRQGMHANCAEQLGIATGLEPDSKQLAELERRLKLNVEAAPPPGDARLAAVPSSSAEQLENTARSLPRGSVEKFGAIVQPILLNRCGANQCHGPNSKAEFRLLRPPAGQMASRRFTQRNLYATLQQLDRADPAASPLLTLPQQRHGSSLTAVFDKHSQNQLTQLQSWVALTIGAASAVAAPTAAAQPPVPPTIAPASATLPQPAAAAPGTTSPNETPAVGVRAMRPQLDGSAAAPRGAAPPRFSPRDRYDPEIFNRQYHK
jgi:hypothetical protein